MSLRPILAAVAVFLMWSVLDFITHGLLLEPTSKPPLNCGGPWTR